jgi:hypothetical protein
MITIEFTYNTDYWTDEEIEKENNKLFKSVQSHLDSDSMVIINGMAIE